MSPGVAAAAGNAGPRCQASPPTRAATAGLARSPARDSRGASGPPSTPHLLAPGGRAHNPRSRARPAPPPGPRGPPPGQPLAQRRGPRAAPASPRSPGPAPQGRAGHRPVHCGRGPGTPAPRGHVLAAGLRHTNSRSGQVGGPCMAPLPPARPGAHRVRGPSRPGRAEGVNAAPPAAPPAVTRRHPSHRARGPYARLGPRPPHTGPSRGPPPSRAATRALHHPL